MKTILELRTSNRILSAYFYWVAAFRSWWKLSGSHRNSMLYILGFINHYRREQSFENCLERKILMGSILFSESVYLSFLLPVNSYCLKILGLLSNLSYTYLDIFPTSISCNDHLHKYNMNLWTFHIFYLGSTDPFTNNFHLFKLNFSFSFVK